MRNYLLTVLALGGLSLPLGAITISNGVSGDGAWSVDALAGGETRSGIVNPTGSQGANNVVFDYFHYVIVNGVGTQLGSTNVTTAANLSGTNQVTSSGSFQGQNGVINWTAVSSIAAGSPIYQTRITFNSAGAFGIARLVQYLDEDVLGAANDQLVVVGNSGAAGFQLLTVDTVANFGVSQSAGFTSATGMSYAGWAARNYNSMKPAIANNTQGFSTAGTITGLNSTTDARYPGLPIYTGSDIVTALAFDLNPNATSASIVLSLGGSVSGDAVATPDPVTPAPSDPAGVPEPSTAVTLALGFSVLAFRMRGRR